MNCYILSDYFMITSWDNKCVKVCKLTYHDILSLTALSKKGAQLYAFM